MAYEFECKRHPLPCSAPSCCCPRKQVVKIKNDAKFVTGDGSQILLIQANELKYFLNQGWRLATEEEVRSFFKKTHQKREAYQNLFKKLTDLFDIK